MGIRSLLLAAMAFSPVILAQQGTQSALPQVTGPGGSSNSCDGCYVVADIAGIVFGNEVLTVTHTNLVATAIITAGTVSRATVVMTKTVFSTETQTQAVSQAKQVGQFTFDGNGQVQGGPGTVFNPLTSEITISGRVLTSPTAYELFTAYSVTRSSLGADGSCTTSSGSKQLVPSPFVYTVPEHPGDSDFDNAESSFINFIGSPSCSAGGGQLQTTVQSMFTATTVTTTASTPIHITPQAISSVAKSTIVASASQTFGSSPSYTLLPVAGANALVRNGFFSWLAGVFGAAAAWYL